jgi:hypothetical protein
VNEAVNVVEPAVQKDDWMAIGGARFSVPDAQDAGIDLLQ